MSLNLKVTPPLSAFNEAVNDARFVRTFGFIVLVGSILAFLGGAVAIGVGVAVVGFGGSRYYRTLGIAVTILAMLGFVIFPLRILAAMVLATAIIWKGISILRILNREGKEDSDWQPARARAITGIAVSIIGIVCLFGWLGLFLLGSLARGAGR